MPTVSSFKATLQLVIGMSSWHASVGRCQTLHAQPRRSRDPHWYWGEGGPMPHGMGHLPGVHVVGREKTPLRVGATHGMTRDKKSGGGGTHGRPRVEDVSCHGRGMGSHDVWQPPDTFLKSSIPLPPLNKSTNSTKKKKLGTKQAERFLFMDFVICLNLLICSYTAALKASGDLGGGAPQLSAAGQRF